MYHYKQINLISKTVTFLSYLILSDTVQLFSSGFADWRRSGGRAGRRHVVVVICSDSGGQLGRWSPIHQSPVLLYFQMVPWRWYWLRRGVSRDYGENGRRGAAVDSTLCQKMRIKILKSKCSTDLEIAKDITDILSLEKEENYC